MSSVAATLLFGSLSRGDQSQDSDTDLLMITHDDETRHVSVGSLSLFFYPWNDLENKARNGDLFVCHLVRESKPLFDPNDYLSKLKEAFEFRSDYLTEIGHATDLGWYLVRFGDDLNSQLRGKRALWCIRTILIARSAERRNPVFAPQLLAQQTKSVAGCDFLSRRHEAWKNAELRHTLRIFLEEESYIDPLNELADRDTFINRFQMTSNTIALNTLQQEKDSKAEYC